MSSGVYVIGSMCLGGKCLGGKGRRQNSLAAAPIFSSQLQPSYIGKAIHSS